MTGATPLCRCLARHREGLGWCTPIPTSEEDCSGPGILGRKAIETPRTSASRSLRGEAERPDGQAVGSKVRVESNVIKKGRTLAVGDVDLLSDQGKLIAKARVTYSISQTG